jgi:hypothetical protein
MKKVFSVILIAIVYVSQTAFLLKQPLAENPEIKKTAEKVTDKGKWILKPDVMYWDNWPVAQPFLLFGANVYSKNDWFLTWEKLDHNPQVEEVIRNLPVRHPLIWL